jgi:hypothetical protein
MAQAASKHTTKPTACPVLPLALRVGGLWDAHAAAQEKERVDTKDDEDISEQIEELRIAVEETASFERARSWPQAMAFRGRDQNS